MINKYLNKIIPIKKKTITNKIIKIIIIINKIVSQVLYKTYLWELLEIQ